MPFLKYNIVIFEVNTNRMPSFSLLAAGSFILRLHLTTPSTQTAMSTTLTAPVTTPPKKVPMPRGAFVAVCMQEENKPAKIIRQRISQVAKTIYMKLHECKSTHVHMTNEYSAQSILITITSMFLGSA